MCHICEICGHAEVRKFWFDLANMNFKRVYGWMHPESRFRSPRDSSTYFFSILLENILRSTMGYGKVDDSP